MNSVTFTPRPDHVRTTRRSLVACDIASFGDRARTDHVQHHLRRALYKILRDGFERSAQFSFNDCYHEDRGDGVILIVPPHIRTALLISPLLDWLKAGLRRHNQLSSPIAQIQLRVALHTGEVHADRYGILGTAVNHVFRLLNAPVLKSALADSGAPLAFIASEQVYEEVIRHGPELIDPDDYYNAEVHVKETTCCAWIRLPGHLPPHHIAIGGAVNPLTDHPDRVEATPRHRHLR
jgi:hypothetical protein